jgi:hypothetical protein
MYVGVKSEYRLQSKQADLVIEIPTPISGENGFYISSFELHLHDSIRSIKVSQAQMVTRQLRSSQL